MATFGEWREQVRERTDLLAVVQQTVEVKGRSGRVHKARCPFHNDDGPSLAVYAEQQRWWCFACGEGGDVFSWVEKRDHVDHVSAVRSLAQDAGIKEPDWREESEESRDQRQAAQALLKVAADFYHERLMTADAAGPHRQYLMRRGFQSDTLELWHVGAAGSGNDLLKHFEALGSDLALAKEIGLIGEKDGRRFDWFRNRVVIPFLSGGQVTFMTGRAIDSNEPKYLHLPNSRWAVKTPYNGRNSAKNAVVVEGPLDVWAVESLAPDSICAVALMGLGYQDPALQKALARRDAVYIGLDSDGTVDAGKVEGVVHVAGAMKAKLLPSWPGGDDAATWLKSGATAEEFAELVKGAKSWGVVLVEQISQADDEVMPGLVRKAVDVACGMPRLDGDALISNIKKAAKRLIAAATINDMVKHIRKDQEEKAESERAKNSGENSQEAAYYFEADGEIWRGPSEPRRVVRGATMKYISMVTVDDGEAQELELELQIKLAGGRTLHTRIPAKESNEAGKVAAYIKEVTGPLATIEAKQGPYLVPAIETLSGEMSESTEIVRTGWIETDCGLAYVTPGGIVGSLPEGFTVVAPPKQPKTLALYAVHDDGDDAFKAGVYGIVEGLLKAFQPTITYPALAFALLPVLARFIGEHKFAMHISGETGSLKTETSKVLMSFYGNFSTAPAVQSWRSTVNAIEQMGFWLPDALGMVDDYKPVVVKKWDFVELIQRYADKNDRSRMKRDGGLTRRQAMRWWMLSTGEDIPQGEASVLARMVLLRFPRRPMGSPFNNELALAQRHAKYLPTVTARWAAWLMENAADQGLEAKLTLYHQQLAVKLQEKVPQVPNINRISRNIAMLQVCWETWWQFVADQMEGQDAKQECERRAKEFARYGFALGLEVSRQVVEEKPTRAFLDTLQEGIDGGRWKLIGRRETTAAINIAGWFDDDGVYLLPSMYNDVSKWLRESGQQVGFTKQELYRLLKEEGLLARKGDEAMTVVVQVGPPSDLESRRVLHLKPGVLQGLKFKGGQDKQDDPIDIG